MAGDWIKMRNDLATDPAVIAIAQATESDEDAIVGKLHKLWSWADRHTTDGNAVGVTTSWINRFVAVSKFAESMIFVGWLEKTDTGVSFTNFSKHNGESAKARALTAKRVARHKSQKQVTQAPLPREEKRREENNKESNPPPPKQTDDMKSVPIPAQIDTPDFRSAWSDWQQHRRERKPKLTPTAARQQLENLSLWGPSRAVVAIKHSIANGWQGIFEPKQDRLDRPAKQEAFSGIKAFAASHGLQIQSGTEGGTEGAS